MKFKRFFDKHVLLHGDEAVISANPLRLSLFHKTSFLHVAMRKLQRQPWRLSCLLSQNTGTPCGKCTREVLGWWKGERAGEGEGCGPRRDTETNVRDPFSCEMSGAVCTRDRMVLWWAVWISFYSSWAIDVSETMSAYFGPGRTPVRHPLAGSAVEVWLYLWPFWTVLCRRHGCELWLTAQHKRPHFVFPVPPPSPPHLQRSHYSGFYATDGGRGTNYWKMKS